MEQKETRKAGSLTANFAHSTINGEQTAETTNRQSPCLPVFGSYRNSLLYFGFISISIKAIS